MFGTWAPNLYKYYKGTMDALFEHDCQLRRPFNSVFTAATYNLGPQSVCRPHLDFANLAFGLCAITALGNFDPTQGGHLVLWDCRLVIEFPPGSTILIPSAMVTHSNVPISSHETRYSFTQYAAGALFRWVDQGFQSAAQYRANLAPGALAAHEEDNANRWQFGLDLLPRLPFVSRPPSNA